MSAYPETLFQKLFTYLPITNPLTRDTIKCLRDRGDLLYMPSEYISYILSTLSLIVLVVLYIQWKKPISRCMFTTLSLLSGWKFLYLILGLTCSKMFGTFKICGGSFMMQYLLCVSFAPFVLVLYLLCRYACSHDEKRIPYLQYTLFFAWFWIMRCLVFWINNPLARFVYDRKNQTAGLEIIPLSIDHRFTAMSFIVVLTWIIRTLGGTIYHKAQLRGTTVAFYYKQLMEFTSLFVTVWVVANSALYIHSVIDGVPLWIKYVVVLLPYVFYSVFSIWFMYIFSKMTKRVDQ